MEIRGFLIQVLCPAFEDKANHHVIDDPFDGCVVVGEDGGRLEASFEIGEGHLHGGDEQWIDRRVIG